jgi:hypothetical protein
MKTYDKSNYKEAVHLIGETVTILGDEAKLIAVGDGWGIGLYGNFFVSYDEDRDPLDCYWEKVIETKGDENEQES